MEVEQDEYIIPYKCKTLTIPITQEYPIEYEVVSTESWIKLDTEMSDEKNIVLKIEDNSAIFPRISSVEVKNVVKNQTVKIFNMESQILVSVMMHQQDSFLLSRERKVEAGLLQAVAMVKFIV